MLNNDSSKISHASENVGIFLNRYVTMSQSIMGLLEVHGSFNIFVKLVVRAGMAEDLEYRQNISVIAPTDDVLSLFDSDALRRFCKFGRPQDVVAFVGQFVFPNDLYSERLVGKKMWTMCFLGKLLLLDGRNGFVFENATVLFADIEAGNGVLHGIDYLICGLRAFVPELQDGQFPSHVVSPT